MGGGMKLSGTQSPLPDVRVDPIGGALHGALTPGSLRGEGNGGHPILPVH